MTENSLAVIIGASHAGAQLAASLRQEGWAGEIVLIGEEPGLPYHRPPLSKAYLSGRAGLEELLIRSAEFYEKQHITRRHAHVVAIYPQTHSLVLSDGSEMTYDKLALCVGARPRQLPLPGAGLAGVHYLRTAEDIEAIKLNLGQTRQAVIIGGGYIGLETAASLRTLGVNVMVLEGADRVLQRVTAPEVSAFYARVHKEEGVDLRTGVALKALVGEHRVTGVALADGQTIPADLVIIGIGIIPNTALAEGARLAVDNGIVINAQGLTSNPDIVAAGDCANHFCPIYQRRVRVESVPNAGEHAKVAAATLCGKEKEIKALPWFWSDQFDIKLQIAGLNQGYDQVVLRGDPAQGRSFACFYLRDGKLLAADCINRPQEFLFSKRVISGKLSLRADLLADESVGLDDLVIPA